MHYYYELEKGKNHLKSLTLVLSMASDGKSVGCKRSLDFGVVEVDDGAVILEHVHLLYSWYVVDSQLLEGALELLVVSGGSPVHHLLLPPGRSWASNPHLGLQLGQLLSIHFLQEMKQKSINEGSC